jgi:hypothetical protein
LEANVAFYSSRRKLFSTVYAASENCLVGFELNRVQQIVNNHNLNIDPEKLNSYFLDGYQLNIDFQQAGDFQFRPAIQSIDIIKGDVKTALYHPSNVGDESEIINFAK